jgi:leucyl aminopeptidase
MSRLSWCLATLAVWATACQESSIARISEPVDEAPAADERDLSNDRDVYVTVGADAVPAFTNRLVSLRAAGSLSVRATKGGVSVLRMRESQLGSLGAVVHETFHRCGGFEMHDTEAQALAALEPVVPAQHAAAIAYTLDNAAVVNSLMGSLASSNVLATVSGLSSYKNRYYTSQTGADAALWLKSQWQTLAQGRTDITVETFTHAAWLQPSIILTVTGKTLPAEVVVLGAHVDSINQSNPGGFAPGADDDASGIATLTEVLRSLVVNDFHPNRTVKFMAYAAEEVGLRGSKEIAAKFKADAVNVVGVMQLDMTNYKGSNADIVIITDYTNSAQNTFVGSLIDTYVKVVRTNSSCGYACSDHASWSSKGYATSMPFESLLNDSNPSIHTENDTLAQTQGNTDNSMKFAKLAAAFVGELAKGSLGTHSPETTPPMAAITAPAAGAMVSGNVAITAEASDNVGVTRVDFLVDGAVVGSDTSAPYTFSWNTTAISNGTHVLAATAYDPSNNSTRSVDVQVTLNNVGITMASYDPIFRVPACGTAATACDSGALLVGRGSAGPEVSQPNTSAARVQTARRAPFTSTSRSIAWSSPAPMGTC